ncbi:hypothetical protein PoB_000199200 [Plakobranchus ocellatus]|uniref:Uncharacterized protein n=1 Tax=Plakobranchus ocellatus TaxID=259542 RepID=A0AAV3Y065_9GAST|nr:hypothetical protein PoB_000199200 [Plakobranchus ocellatus]
MRNRVKGTAIVKDPAIGHSYGKGCSTVNVRAIAKGTPIANGTAIVKGPAIVKGSAIRTALVNGSAKHAAIVKSTDLKEDIAKVIVTFIMRGTAIKKGTITVNEAET